MKGSIPEDKIEEIRRRTDIVSLIGEYVTLKKAGKNFLGLCPFHQEKTPSFTVSPDKQMFYCFGCSEGGNVFSFLMKLNHLTFPEAVRQLAGKVGVVIPEKTHEPRRRGNVTPSRSRSAGSTNLRPSTLRRRSSRRRGRGPGSISGSGESARRRSRTFRLGLAPEGWRNLLDFLEKKGIAPELGGTGRSRHSADGAVERAL